MIFEQALRHHFYQSFAKSIPTVVFFMLGLFLILLCESFNITHILANFFASLSETLDLGGI